MFQHLSSEPIFITDTSFVQIEHLCLATYSFLLTVLSGVVATEPWYQAVSFNSSDKKNICCANSITIWLGQVKCVEIKS